MSTSGYLPPECWRGMYRVMQRANVNAIRVSLETGMRIDDVLSMRPEQLDEGLTFVYVAKKTKKPGTATLSLELWRELKLSAGELWVFPGRDPRKHRTRQAVYRDLKKAASVLGIEGQISPHSARKTFAVELRKKEGIAEVQKALQHTDRNVTRIYAYADIDARSSGDVEAFAEILAEKICKKIEQLFILRGIF